MNPTTNVSNLNGPIQNGISEKDLHKLTQEKIHEAIIRGYLDTLRAHTNRPNESDLRNFLSRVYNPILDSNFIVLFVQSNDGGKWISLGVKPEIKSKKPTATDWWDFIKNSLDQNQAKITQAVLIFKECIELLNEDVLGVENPGLQFREGKVTKVEPYGVFFNTRDVVASKAGFYGICTNNEEETKEYFSEQKMADKISKCAPDILTAYGKFLNNFSSLTESDRGIISTLVKKFLSLFQVA